MTILAECDESFAKKARFRFVHDISSAASPTQTFDIVAGSDLESEWFPDFVSSEWQTAEPHGAGSVRIYRLKFMTILEEFLVWERGSRLVFRVNECSLPILHRFLENYVITPRPGGGSNLRWEICYEPRRSLRFLHPFIRPFFARDFRKAARQLEALLNRLEPMNDKNA
jgi:Polyketide cyclase / dehydrase and lipid transport